MKPRPLFIAIAVFAALVCIAATINVRPGLKISEYPNNGFINSNALFITEKGDGSTNENISFGQLALRVTNSINASMTNTMKQFSSNLVVVLTGTNTYVTKTSTNGTNFYTVHGDKSVVLTGTNTHVVNTFTNGTNFYVVNNSQSAFAALEVQTNTVRLGLVTNINWTYGMTGSVSSSTAILGVDDSFANAAISNSLFTSITNLSNFVTASSLPIGSNILNVQYSPQQGATYYTGTNGTPTTNQARAGLEFSPFWRSIRMGEVAAGADPLGVVGNGSNYWNNTNIGPCTVGFGSNAFVKGAFSSVLGGAENHIMTGSVYCVIAAGSGNYIRTNIDSSSILGGTQNRIDSDGFGMSVAGNSVIAGGTNNIISGRSRGSFIGAGENNRTAGLNSIIVGGKDNQISDTNSAGDVIGGGDNHLIGGATTSQASYCVIAGGFNHQIDENADYSVISGGRDNLIGGGVGASGTNNTISGGAFNTTGSLGNRKFGFISGGERNTCDANYGFIIGTSNAVGPNANFCGTIGVWLTNDVNNTLLLGYGNLVGKVRVKAATNATVGGIVMSTTTTVASAGSAETNLITRTIPAHTLTNDQDRLTFRASGRFAATSNAKQLKVVFGSETVLDGTSQVQNGGAWTIEGEIIRTGDTAQSVNAELHCASTNGMTTTSSLNLTQTNGINTVLKVTSTASGDGDVTNRTMTVWLWPSPQ